MSQTFMEKFLSIKDVVSSISGVKPVMVVGTESTKDVWVTFPSIHAIRTFATNLDGKIKTEFNVAYSLLEAGKGDERVIDGLIDDQNTLFDTLRSQNVEIEHSLGGNGALESSALSAMGAQTIFVGKVFPKSLITLPPTTKFYFIKNNMEYADKASKDSSAISLIVQAEGSDRVILCDGSGRRWKDLKPYILSLPDIINDIFSKYDAIDAINLVGWHVIFAKGVRDLDLVEPVLEDIKLRTKIFFTDTGALTKINPDDRKNMFEKIYDKFDILSVNEVEIVQLFEALFPNEESIDPVNMGTKILSLAKNIKMIWFHSRTFNCCIKSKSYLDNDSVETAAIFSAIAGAVRVEKGTYPEIPVIVNRLKNVLLSREGISSIEEIMKRYNAKESMFLFNNYDCILVPSLTAQSFQSEVGAGDTASAGFTFMLSSLVKKNED